MSRLPLVADHCEPARFVLRTPLEIVQIVGAILIPVVAVIAIGYASRRYPTNTLRWTSRRMLNLLGNAAVLPLALGVLALGTIAYSASVAANTPIGAGCQDGLIAGLGPLGLLLTLVGAISAAAAEAARRQLGWVLLAAFFALDIWILFGMLMMHLESDPRAPDPMLLLAFGMHAVCMILTTVWAFHARNLSTMAQIRADEAGRSIGAVWLFLAGYIIVGHFQRDRSPFESEAGGAVLSALTLSALALTMGGGYTKYREVMAEERPAVGGLEPTTKDEVTDPSGDAAAPGP
ncbi:MAG: hypothetical protein O3A42_11300 [Actinobacteria bacterium]|nr:hypothetical protein [Actinomycetota bacterium]